MIVMLCLLYLFVFFFKQKTAYEMRISDWSSDVCSSDLDSGCATCEATIAGVTLNCDDDAGSASCAPAKPMRASSCRPFGGAACHCACRRSSCSARNPGSSAWMRLRIGGCVANRPLTPTPYPNSKIGTTSCGERGCQEGTHS